MLKLQMELKQQARALKTCVTDWDHEQQQQLNETAENLDVVSSGLQLEKDQQDLEEEHRRRRTPFCSRCSS